MPERPKMILIVSFNEEGEIQLERYGANLMSRMTTKIIGDLHEEMKIADKHTPVD